MRNTTGKKTSENYYTSVLRIFGYTRQTARKYFQCCCFFSFCRYMLCYALVKLDKVYQIVKPGMSAVINTVLLTSTPGTISATTREYLLRATFIRSSYYMWYYISTHTTPTPLLKLIGVNRKAVTCKLTELNHTAPNNTAMHGPTPTDTSNERGK